MDDDYRIEHRPPGPTDGAPLHDLQRARHGYAVFPDDVYEHPEYYTGFGHTPQGQKVVNLLRRLRGKPDAQVTVYRALPGGHQQINSGDWVTTSPEYARDHGRQDDPRHDWPVIKARVPAKHLWTSGDELMEHGYHGPDVQARIHYRGRPAIRQAARQGIPAGTEFHFQPGEGVHHHRLELRHGELLLGHMTWAPRDGDVGMVDTHPQYRRRGIGTALVTKAHELSAQHDLAAPDGSVFHTGDGAALRDHLDSTDQRPDLSHIPTHVSRGAGEHDTDLRQHLIEHHYPSSTEMVAGWTDEQAHHAHEQISRFNPCGWQKTGASEPLPHGDGLFWRFHHRDSPFGPEHARSYGLHGDDEPQPGHSSFANPHDLHHYLHAMDWVDAPDEVDFHDRDVIGFHGHQIGTGLDGEPLVMPHDAQPAYRMGWGEFQRRLRNTPGKPGWTLDMAKRAAAEPLTVRYIRNPQSSQAHGGFGEQYGQHIEPAGRYLSERSGEHVPDGWESGTVVFHRPLHLQWGEDYRDPSSWKHQLHRRYDGKTGDELSQAIAADGYDGIVTHDRYGTNEIVDLTHLHKRAAQETPMQFGYDEQETGGSKYPTRARLTLLHPEHGPVGSLTFFPPRRSNGKLKIDRLEVDPEHRRQGHGSALMDELQRRWPKASVDHGDRTDDGKAWWSSYGQGADRRGRTAGMSWHPIPDHALPRSAQPEQIEEAVPKERGLYWRLHHRDAPFGPEHANSISIGGREESQPGFSSFSNPHDLHRYLHEMEWVGHPEVEFDDRDVVGFKGRRVGTGVDGESLVMPRSDQPEYRMGWDEFSRRIKNTPGKARWNMGMSTYGRRLQTKWVPLPDHTLPRPTVKIAAGHVYYHITDNPDFALDPHRSPERNTTDIASATGNGMKPGIFLTDEPERWVNGHGYVRPYVAEIHAPADLHEHEGVHTGGYQGETYVEAPHFDKLHINRVIPLDAHARERYGDAGWIEEHHGTAFDTGDKLTSQQKINGYRGYRYDGPDARDMDEAARTHHYNRWADYMVEDRGHDREDFPRRTASATMADVGLRWRPSQDHALPQATAVTAMYDDWDGEFGDYDEEREPREDWDAIHRSLDLGIHRGVGLHLSPEDHAIVHDEQRPMHERAAHLLGVLHRTGHDGHGGVGTHWTPSEYTAHDFALSGAKSAVWEHAQKVREGTEKPHGFDEDGDPQTRPATYALLHAETPERHHIDEFADPRAHGSGDIYGYDEHGEHEVPLHPGADLHIKSISWKPVYAPGEEPHDFDDEETVHHFHEPLHVTAGLDIQPAWLKRAALSFEHHGPLEGGEHRVLAIDEDDKPVGMIHYKHTPEGVRYEQPSSTRGHEQALVDHVRGLHPDAAPRQAPAPQAESEHTGPWYHGTTTPNLKWIKPAGPNRKVTFPHETDRGYAYATGSESDARWYAELAWNSRDRGRQRVYEVEPTGPVERDPSHDEKGRSRGNMDTDYRSRHPWRVVRELPPPEHTASTGNTMGDAGLGWTPLED